jgi:RNA polymerase sigma-70 factor (ECF subfamily)
MADDSSFADLMTRLRAGDEAAAAVVFHRFAQQLIRLARLHLDTQIRQKVDPEDVAQSVYKSFFLRHAEGQYQLANWPSLWGLLTVITLRKCARWQEHFRTQGRDVGAEVPCHPAGDSSGPGWEALAREPSPAEAALLAETVAQLLAGLEGRDREIVTLALQGYRAPEISDRLRRPERTVYRVLRRIEQRLQELRAEGEEPA